MALNIKRPRSLNCQLLRHEREDSFQAILFIALLIVMIRTGYTRFHALLESSKFAPSWLRRQLNKILIGEILGQNGSFVKAIADIRNCFPVRYNWIRFILEEIFVSASERNASERNARLDRIFGTALVYCRHSIKEFFGGLRVPLTSIFAICIILPILVASMLPLIDISAGAEIGAGSTSDTLKQSHEISFFSPTFLLSVIILAFPMVCAIATGNLIDRASEFLQYSDKRSINARMLIFLLFTVAGLIIMGILLDIDLSVPFILGTGILFCLFSEMYNRSRRITVLNIDEIFQEPSFLNEVSSRIGHGEHHVKAFSLASGGTRISWAILWSYLAPVNHKNIDKRTISKFLMESAHRDPEITSEIMRGLSSHFTEIKIIKDDSKIELRSVGQSITVASILLCPFVLGLVGGLSELEIIRGSYGGTPLAMQEVFAVLVVEMAFVGGLVNFAFFSNPNKRKIALETPVVALSIAAAIFLVSRGISEFIFF